MEYHFKLKGTLHISNAVLDVILVELLFKSNDTILCEKYQKIQRKINKILKELVVIESQHGIEETDNENT